MEEAIIAQARPRIVAAMARSAITHEASKGCVPELSSIPVALEPTFEPIMCPQDLPQQHDPGKDAVAESPPDAADLVRLKLWISPEQKCDWTRSERFVKQLSAVRHRVGFELVGNSTGISICLLCCRRDEDVVRSALRGEFPAFETTVEGRSAVLTFPGTGILVRDYYPPPPYSHLLTRPEEIKLSTFGPLLSAMNELPERLLGIYQCLLQPVRRQNTWDRNVAALMDIEYLVRSLRYGQVQARYLQQPPSGDLWHMANNLAAKAHSDKPLYFVAARFCLVGDSETMESAFDALCGCMSLLQHGCRPLDWVDHRTYAAQLSPIARRRMFAEGITYRPGFLVNSQELTGLVHIPQPTLIQERRIPIEMLEPLRLERELDEGTCIGTYERAGREIRVHIPPILRERGIHIMAAPRAGKTSELIGIALQDADEGDGGAFIDPHGDGIKTLMGLLPRRHYAKTIYFNPGDPDWIPLWNPLHLKDRRRASRLANNIISVFQRLKKDWGDRMEHVIRNGIIGLTHIPHPTLYDLYNLTRRKSDESELLRKQIVRTTTEGPVRTFWQTDFLTDYRTSDLGSPKHVLSKLVTGDGFGDMLKQPESAIDFEDIMDTGKLLLVDLSDLGPGEKEVLGSFILTLFFIAALSRSKQAKEKRRRFPIYADEAYTLLGTDALEHMLVQAAKYHVSLCIAHHYLRQFDSQKVDALSTVGTTLIGRVDRRDAQYLTKDFLGRVDAEDILSLKPREMIARIDSDIVKLRTLDLPPPPADGNPDEIIQTSRRLYCRPVAEVKEAIRRRNDRFFSRFHAVSDESTCEFTAEELAYDEF